LALGINSVGCHLAIVIDLPVKIPKRPSDILTADVAASDSGRVPTVSHVSLVRLKRQTARLRTLPNP